MHLVTFQNLSTYLSLANPWQKSPKHLKDQGLSSSSSVLCEIFNYYRTSLV